MPMLGRLKGLALCGDVGEAGTEGPEVWHVTVGLTEAEMASLGS